MNVIAWILLLVACGGNSPACATIFGVDDRDVSIVLFADALRLPATLRVDVAGWAHVLEAPGETRAAVPDGAHRVEVALTVRGADPVRTSFEMGFGPDRHHWVHVFVGSRRPAGHCFGALEVLPLGPAVADSAFVAHGSIPKDAVC